MECKKCAKYLEIWQEGNVRKNLALLKGQHWKRS